MSRPKSGPRWAVAVLAGVVLAIGTVQALAVEPGREKPSLPRAFQRAHLGMAMAELIRTDPQIAKTALSTTGRQADSLTVSSSDPYIHRHIYRFYRGALYEQAIVYRPDRVPRGYDGLLDRLREIYGRPVVENVEDYDLSRDIFSARKTVWRDDMTRITLAELRKLKDGREQYELVLTMTDLSLEQARDQAAQERLRRKELSVPVPLPDRQRTSAETTGPHEVGRMGAHG